MEVTALCFRLLMIQIIQLGTQGSFCTFARAYLGDSGEYWCETDGGERSNTVNITVTAGSVILESPVHPVMEGDNVTLRCRDKENSPNLRADFYKDGVFMQSSPVAEMTINSVSKSDEGLYRCSISGGGTSPESWLAVRANSVSATSQTPHKESHTDLLWIAVITLMVSLVLLLVGFLCIWTHRGTVLCSSSKTSAGSEDNHIVCGDDAADDPSSVSYAVVVKKKRQDTAGAAAEHLSLETNHRRNPPTQKDEDESSVQPVYSTLKVDYAPQPLQPAKSGLSSSTFALKPTDPSPTEQEEVVYSPIK
ncbi:low affinity immunoglobulin gamma Fc region receptor II-a-like isoform X6, partial [Scomber scombrus]